MVAARWLFSHRGRLCIANLESPCQRQPELDPEETSCRRTKGLGIERTWMREIGSRPQHKPIRIARLAYWITAAVPGQQCGVGPMRELLWLGEAPKA
jgi:hypothetical protein